MGSAKLEKYIPDVFSKKISHFHFVIDTIKWSCLFYQFTLHFAVAEINSLKYILKKRDRLKG